MYFHRQLQMLEMETMFNFFKSSVLNALQTINIQQGKVVKTEGF